MVLANTTARTSRILSLAYAALPTAYTLFSPHGGLLFFRSVRTQSLVRWARGKGRTLASSASPSSRSPRRSTAQSSYFPFRLSFTTDPPVSVSAHKALLPAGCTPGKLIARHQTRQSHPIRTTASFRLHADSAVSHECRARGQLTEVWPPKSQERRPAL